MPAFISKCSYIYCNKKLNITRLHKFPLSDPALLKQWVDRMRGKDWVLNQQSALCSAHFKSDCFDEEGSLKANAVPSVFISARKARKKKRKKGKDVIQAIQFYKNFFGKTEKECNKCGFASFSLHILYTHRYKCDGRLMGPSLKCCFCKRKFNFFVMYRNHKSTCVQAQRKKKYLMTKIIEKHFAMKQKGDPFVNDNVSVVSNNECEDYSISCSNCKVKFATAEKYNAHKKDECHSLPKKKCKFSPIPKERSFSARKSFPNSKFNKVSAHSDTGSAGGSQDTSLFKAEISNLDSLKDFNKTRFECTHCKNLYSTKKLLFNHLEKNMQCAEAYYRKPSVKRVCDHSARKSLPKRARKSFLGSIKMPPLYGSMNVNKNFGSGSARKSFGQSSNVRSSKIFSCGHCKENFYTSADFNLHEKHCNLRSSFSNIICPVCLQEFTNASNLLQHQKKTNHWGKATKSLSSLCKCPFCDKDFSNVKSRNYHLASHPERFKEIGVFLNDTTCETCCDFFATKSGKLQHVKIAHGVTQRGKNSDDDDSSGKEGKTEIAKLFKDISLPESVRKKMKMYPNKCPICKNSFTTIFNRNRHYLRVHMMETTVECQFCDIKCTRTDLVYHMQEHHNDKLEFQCVECLQRFESKIQASHHATQSHPNLDTNALVLNLKDKQLVAHNEGEYVLTESNTKSSLSNNEFRMKNNEFYCDICNISFSKIYGLQRHRQSKIHRDTITESLDAVRESLSNLPSIPSPVPEASAKQPEILSCSECLEEFTTMMDFVPHRLSHFSSQTQANEISEVNPYTCEICTKLLDSHQRVQVHLFGHLQSKGASNEIAGSSQIIPDRLSGKQIAKKSFLNKGKSSSQEVFIGGIKKSLFTCEACGISFMTEHHRASHIRRFCKARSNYTDILENVDSKHLTPENVLAEIQNSKIDQECKESNSSTSKSTISGNCIQCKICNCVFAGTEIFQKHVDGYCSNSHCDDNASDLENKLNVLKSAIEDRSISAGCISCGLPFHNLPSLSEHMNIHKTELVKNMAENIGGKQSKSIKPNPNKFNDNSVDLTKTTYQSLSSEKLKNDSGLSNSDNEDTMSDNSSSKIIDALRKNFAKLLCVLISDTELMEQLGYGEKIIDEVLINVLQQMGETPVVSGESELENLRKNIQILLDICLKDQVMQIIADGQTLTDNVVVEALKMFSSEEEAPAII